MNNNSDFSIDSILQDAEETLKNADDGSKPTVTINEDDEGVAGGQESNCDASDDLAAAFFANQASSSRLQLDLWAKLINAHNSSEHPITNVKIEKEDHLSNVRNAMTIINDTTSQEKRGCSSEIILAYFNSVKSKLSKP
mmetsp:Transcript_10345/g.14830  ORF Transcript_10345/g.14830 Transcript_10345/m.14830 type:complete len:139 (+) Transcript_10345:22-438(+)